MASIARRIIVLIAGTAIAAASFPAAAAPGRTIRGSVLAPAGDQSSARCAWLQRGEASQGILGYMIKLSAREGDNYRPFTFRGLDAQSPSLPVDIVHRLKWRVTFYGSDLGTCARAPASLGYHPRPGDGDHPLIPWRSRYALVTAHAGASPGLMSCYGLTVQCIAWVDSIEAPSSAGAQPFVFTIHR